MDYAYANGVIKAIEGTLFDKSKYAKLAKTERHEFTSVLLNFGIGSTTSDDSIENILNSEAIKVKLFIDGLSPNRRYSDAFYITNDALNLKMLYKEKLFHINRPDALSGAGAMDSEALKNAVINQDLSGISIPYRRLLETIEETTKNTVNPRILSAQIDACLFEFTKENVSYGSSKSLMTYFQGLMDFANVVTLVRSRTLKWGLSDVSFMLIPGGTIPLSVLKEAYLLEGENFAKHFQPYYNESVSKHLRKYFENHNVNTLELKLDGLLLELISQFRDDAFSIGPILYYYLEKQAESKNIRMIYATGIAESADLLEY